MSEPEPIILADPLPNAKQRFEEERLRIAIGLGRLPAAIEHIGSTAIAGIRAKPIIDVLVGLRALPLTAAIAPLVALGYEHVEGAGGDERLYFRRGSPRLYQVHVVLFDSPTWRRHIIFRDWLNLHPDLAREYEALKVDLAARFPHDRDAYAKSKDPFVERVLAEAAEFPALRLRH